ncbi:LPS-assembly protein LptD [Phenylobacterium immobile]|uniref:LPS-assembly protein LptD n=1 Tax=Phenylobacterium immobile TaxID=21 RepID=UPI000A4FBBD6|nr:LPS assembly protein LptD [Phenylobacterium immobile]
MSGTRSRRPSPSTAAKRALLAGAAIAALWSQAALAQSASEKPPQFPTARPTLVEPPSDGLSKGEVFIEADELVQDDENNIVTAQGSVEIRYDQRTLRANRVIYERTPGVIRANGDVQIINADGSVEYAEQLVLDDEMYAGAAVGFSARMGEGVKIAAASALRRNEDIQELNRAIYTPCPICVDDKPRKPTWSISADRVTQDKKGRVIVYKNARIRVLGAPVLFLPVFWHADPTAERASGLLSPDISVSNRRGMSFTQPYLWVVSPYTDVTISPQINTQVNPFVEARVRKRFYSGDMDLRFGYTYERDFDGGGREFGERTSRSYILGRGAFRLDDNWRWGFTAERASDQLIFDKYDVSQVYRTRGPYIADDRRLISQLYAVRQANRSYVSMAAFSIQGLRPTDNDRAFPLIAPLVEARYEPVGDVFGGRLKLKGGMVSLSREQSPTITTYRAAGLDSRRVSIEADWRDSYISPTGLRIDPFVSVRSDAYALSDILTAGGTDTTSRNVTRGLATLGADVSFPFYRRIGDATVVLEPVIQAVYSPRAKQIIVGREATGAPVYLNEDSVAFEFDETTLLEASKFPGYDLYEDGARLNVAGRATVMWDDGRRATATIGRSFRDDPNTIFSERSGLRRRASDWVVALSADPVPGLSFFARSRLDADDFTLRRVEAGANVSTKRGSGYVRYLRDDLDINGRRRENLDIGGDVFVTKNWGVTAYGNRDLSSNAWIIRDYGVFYHDDCIRVDVVYRQEDTVIGTLGPRDSVSVRLTLATLGGPIYGR